MAAPTEWFRLLLACGLACMLAACATAPTRGVDPQADCIGSDAPQSRPGSCAWPRDVRAFVARRDLCDHFRGEEPYDAERAAFLAKRTRQTCSGSDATLMRLRQRYANDPVLSGLLAGFEHPIE